MKQDALVVLSGEQVSRALTGSEREVIDAVARAYEIHAGGDTMLPHSSFLQFPGLEKERIIALPAYLGGDVRTAGLKWIASFPDNVRLGLERASALLLLNSLETGRAYAVLESATISAQRTAASAALAADRLLPPTDVDTVSLIGCGLIGFQILRYLRLVRPSLRRVILHDLDPARGDALRQRCAALGFAEASFASSRSDVWNAPLVALATTSSKPYLGAEEPVRAGTVILNVSLRDLDPSLILRADNVVDDVDHVCRANTSLHLAEQQIGHRRFIRATLGELLLGRARPLERPRDFTVFSPFGLGILDLAVGQLAYTRAAAGTEIADFYPGSWAS